MQIQGASAASQLIQVAEAKSKTESQIGVAVAKLQLDAAKSSGEAMVQLVQQAGRGIDVRA